MNGHKVPPGNYSISLKSRETEASSSFTILPNPNSPLSAEDYQEFDKYMLSMEETASDMHQKVNIIYDLSKQLQNVLRHIDKKNKPALFKQGNVLLSKIKKWDEEMVQRKSKSYDDTGNYPNKFTSEYLFLINQTESSIPRVTDPSRKRLAELNIQWEALSATAGEILDTDIPEFNKKLWEAGIGALWNREKQSPE